MMKLNMDQILQILFLVLALGIVIWIVMNCSISKKKENYSMYSNTSKYRFEDNAYQTSQFQSYKLTKSPFQKLKCNQNCFRQGGSDKECCR